ncbi:MAG: GIY-YIG nuclease family protein [Bacteroidota bacterium]
MKSFLYLIYSEIGFMIGKSSDIYRRFAVIDAHSPIDLQLFRVYRIERNGIHEKRLHKLFISKRIRGGWFALDYDDIEEIDSYLMENDGTRILDNLKKVKPDQDQTNQDSTRPPLDDLIKDIKTLEDVVDKLKGTLDGRSNV